MSDVTFTVDQRPDALWTWRLIHSNGHVLARDGGAGYEHPEDAEAIGLAVCNGAYGPVTVARRSVHADHPAPKDPRGADR